MAASTTRAEHASACNLPEVPPLCKATFDGWRYKHYFEFVERKENNLTVRCTLCPCWNLLSTAANITSNLTKHLQRQHTHTKLVAKEPWGNMNEMPSEQPKLSFQLNQKVLTTLKSEMNMLVALYIAEEMLFLVQSK